jgi:hypothetical protein
MQELTGLMDELSKPFDPNAISWKPQATSGDRALAIPYADPRAYQDRLNQVAGSEWSDHYQVLDGGAVVLCELTVCGVTRSDIGEASPGDRNTATSALAQAFKRAAVKFGIGRYLYDLPKQWVDWDADRKRFTPQARRQLRAALEGRKVERSPAPRPATKAKGNGSNGNGKASATAFWKLYNEHGKGRITRDQAQEWATMGDWALAMGKLKQALN